MKLKKSQPDSLSPEAQTFYRQIVEEWGVADAAGLLALRVACESLDRLRQAQALITSAGLITTDRFGQARAHPATTVEREARAGLISSLKLLDLDLKSLEKK